MLACRAIWSHNVKAIFVPILNSQEPQRITVYHSFQRLMTEAAAFWCLDGLSSTMTNTTAKWWNVGWECGVCMCLYFFFFKNSLNIFTKTQVVLLWSCATVAGPFGVHIFFTSPGIANRTQDAPCFSFETTGVTSPPLTGSPQATTVPSRRTCNSWHKRDTIAVYCCRWHLTGSMKPYYVDIMYEKRHYCHRLYAPLHCTIPY